MNLLEPYSFFFELPLYTKIKIDDSNLKDLMSLFNTNNNIDGYNPSLKQQTTFRVTRLPRQHATNREFRQFEGANELEITCVRNGLKIIYYVFLGYNYNKEDDKDYYFMKIGQYPSVADLHISKIREYNNVLPKDKLKEFTKAVGLAANGIGIGSFVYLRRIFEGLIEEAHILAKNENNWNEDQYAKSRMSEKIDQLDSYLPEFLVENKNLYSILSKGIHELEENECLQYFDAIKVGIELILDEKIEVFNKKRKLEEATKRINLIGQQITKK
ncbi:MAG TPA: hypothetical protein VGI43_19330 [Mucilaginibacter sp.]|jgi:hypothetical protein